jgi:hypothetical protein
VSGEKPPGNPFATPHVGETPAHSCGSLCVGDHLCVGDQFVAHDDNGITMSVEEFDVLFERNVRDHPFGQTVQDLLLAEDAINRGVDHKITGPQLAEAFYIAREECQATLVFQRLDFLLLRVAAIGSVRSIHRHSCFTISLISGHNLNQPGDTGLMIAK